MASCPSYLSALQHALLEVRELPHPPSLLSSALHHRQGRSIRICIPLCAPTPPPLTTAPPPSSELPSVHGCIHGTWKCPTGHHQEPADPSPLRPPLHPIHVPTVLLLVTYSYLSDKAPTKYLVPRTLLTPEPSSSSRCRLQSPSSSVGDLEDPYAVLEPAEAK